MIVPRELSFNKNKYSDLCNTGLSKTPCRPHLQVGPEIGKVRSGKVAVISFDFLPVFEFKNQNCPLLSKANYRIVPVSFLRSPFVHCSQQRDIYPKNFYFCWEENIIVQLPATSIVPSGQSAMKKFH